VTTAKDIFDQTMHKIKNMQMFEIKREVGPNWLPRGSIPFDIHAGGGVATFTVYAEFLQDAEDQVTQFLERQDEDEQD
jgi:hypothetical protein